LQASEPLAVAWTVVVEMTEITIVLWELASANNRENRSAWKVRWRVILMSVLLSLRSQKREKGARSRGDVLVQDGAKED
jgi:hypothetical protein